MKNLVDSCRKRDSIRKIFIYDLVLFENEKTIRSGKTNALKRNWAGHVAIIIIAGR